MTQEDIIIAMAKEAGLWPAVTDTFPKELETFAKLIAAKEQDRCCSIVFSQCESDNVAQRTVDAIRGKA